MRETFRRLPALQMSTPLFCDRNCRVCNVCECIVNPRCACAARVTVVGSVCLLLSLHLTSRVFVRLTKDTIYLTGNEGQKFRTVFSVAKLERFQQCTANVFIIALAIKSCLECFPESVQIPYKLLGIL